MVPNIQSVEMMILSIKKEPLDWPWMGVDSKKSETTKTTIESIPSTKFRFERCSVKGFFEWIISFSLMVLL